MNAIYERCQDNFDYQSRSERVSNMSDDDRQPRDIHAQAISLRELSQQLGLGPLPDEDGAARIVRERRRQTEVEGYDIQHDLDHGPGVLDAAAEGYLWAFRQSLTIQAEGRRYVKPWPTDLWPWGEEAWKPSEDPIRNLEKMGALVAAEIDRILWQQATDRRQEIQSGEAQ